MAKKSASSAGLRRKMSHAAAHVFAECAFASAQGMESTMNGRLYQMAPAATDYWLRIHTVSIPRALKRKTANWKTDRTTVLLMARVLGQKAATYALADAKANLVTVKVVHVRKASKDVKHDRRCRKASAGEGGYCDY